MAHRIIREIENPPEPQAACGALLAQSHPVWLDSGMHLGSYGRFSFVACDPFLVLTAKDRRVELRGAREEVLDADPFEVLDDLLKQYEIAHEDAPVPLLGGAIGYLGYDLGRHIEVLPRTTVDDIAVPDLYLAFYDTVLGYAHETGRAYVCSVELRGDGGAEERAHRLVELARGVAPVDSGREASPGPLQSNFERQDYVAAVAAAKEYIVAGDIFQVNLSQRFQAPLTITPWELYCRLRAINPAPFAAYLGFEGMQVVSASPERFLRVSQGHVQTRPIKGTRPRGSTPAEDRALAEELLGSEKDRAELLMIVDLERNDIGRVCRYGTVKVPELWVLESYPTVHHLVATVTGELAEGRTNVDLLRGSFPGGSITGAPKIRSMEIIDELEPTQRGVYTGSIGYLGFDGEMDLSIVIRTNVVKNGIVYYQVGGGIVADSDPVLEYEETLHKGRALAEALGLSVQ